MKQVSDIQQFKLYTIGHGTRSESIFLNLLNQYKIELLVDVRTFPYSRYNPQFRRIQLEEILKTSGIGYLFMGDSLGGRPDNAELYKNGKLDYLAIKQTSLFKEGIEHVADLVNKNIQVTLMCSESNPNDCHRKHLLSNEFFRKGIRVCHIDKTGDIENYQNHTPRLFD